MSNDTSPVVRVVHHSHENVCYDWVSADVLDYPSDYLTQESIKRFRDDYDLENPRNLNVAPSQLHPNSCAFVRSFIIVCEHFDIMPTSQGNDVFPELLFEADGAPLFPLYWTEKPTRIASLFEAELSVKARSEVEFLKELKKKSIGYSDVIDAEGDSVALERLLGTQSHKGQIPINVDPNTPASSVDPADPAKKRPILEENSEATSDQAHSIPAFTQPTTEAGQNSPIARPPPLDKWWLIFENSRVPKT
ncbi:hypothetical protein SESBI_08406 [Sesbania bispinosa]|nr:hypothetical protein SESBI_08406 [Sesbania bispinosa]